MLRSTNTWNFFNSFGVVCFRFETETGINQLFQTNWFYLSKFTSLYWNERAECLFLSIQRSHFSATDMRDNRSTAQHGTQHTVEKWIDSLRLFANRCCHTHCSAKQSATLFGYPIVRDCITNTACGTFSLRDNCWLDFRSLIKSDRNDESHGDNQDDNRSWNRSHKK